MNLPEIETVAPPGFIPPDWYTADYLAERFDCTTNTINENLNAHKVPYRKFGGRRIVRWQDVIDSIPAKTGPEKARGGRRKGECHDPR